MYQINSLTILMFLNFCNEVLSSLTVCGQKNMYICPFSALPITIKEFMNQSEVLNETECNDLTKMNYWTSCALSDYSCVRIRIEAQKYLFYCMADQRIDVKPSLFAAFDEVTETYNISQLAEPVIGKSCPEKRNSWRTRFETSVAYKNVTILTDVACCKGEKCKNLKILQNWDKDDGKQMKFKYRVYMSWPFLCSTVASSLILVLSMNLYSLIKEKIIFTALLKLHPNHSHSHSTSINRLRKSPSVVSALLRNKKHSKSFEFLLPNKQV